MPEEEKDKALIVFDYIYHAMRAKHVLEEAGFKLREVSPPVEYRTGCDLAIEVDATDVDAAENLLIEKEDIETLPIFTREGVSWNKLDKVFGGELETIIHEINEAIAA